MGMDGSANVAVCRCLGEVFGVLVGTKRKGMGFLKK